MQKAVIFGKFLQNNSLLSEEELALYHKTLESNKEGGIIDENDLESQLIFSLADLFKMFDTEQFYDMAERLFKRWEDSCQTVKPTAAEKIARAVDRLARKKLYGAFIGILCTASCNPSNKLVLSTDPSLLPGHAFASTPSSKYFFESFPLEDEGKKSFSKLKQSSNSPKSVYSKLYNVSLHRQEKKKFNEKIKNQLELQQCTFHPQVISSARSNSSQLSNCYDRLSYSRKKDILLNYEALRKVNEMKNCTFSPSILHSKSQSYDEPIHSRLHRQGELQSNYRRSQEIDKFKAELSGCTFSPRINNQRSINSSGSGFFMPVHQKLFQESDRKKKAHEKKELAREEELEKECTFHPRLQTYSKQSGQIINSKELNSQKPTHEKLYEKHQQKQIMMDIKRKELEEEERKMHQIVHTMRKQPTKSKLLDSTLHSFSQEPLGLKPKSTLNGQFRSFSKNQKESSQNNEETFERLYKLNKEMKERQKKWQDSLMAEQGCCFQPKINSKYKKSIENDPKISLARNNTLVQQSKNKIVPKSSTLSKECTFRPHFVKSPPSLIRNPSNSRKNIVDRLSSYIDYYDRRKEEFTNIHSTFH